MIQIFSAHGTDGTDQPKVVQEVLADLKMVVEFTRTIENMKKECQDKMGEHKRSYEEAIRKEKAENAAKFARLELTIKNMMEREEMEKDSQKRKKEEARMEKENLKIAFQESEKRVKEDCARKLENKRKEMEERLRGSEEKENKGKAENAAKIAALELNIKELLKDKKKEKEAKRKECSALEVCIACISTRS